MSGKSAIYFAYVWPEHTSSAAGVRSLELLSTLSLAGYSVTAMSSSLKNSFTAGLERLGIRTEEFLCNRSERDSWLKEQNPELVIFDRFVTEEQFGWKVRELCPRARIVIDSQDLHFLRRERERMLQAGASLEEILAFSSPSENPDLLRELASYYRADLTLILSPFELELLTTRFGIPKSKLLYWPMFGVHAANTPGYQERSGLAFLGNYRHPPNLDGVLWFLREIWPEYRGQNTQATLALYGAYPPKEIASCHGKNGVEFCGPVDNHREALSRHRALIAPLRFGAGIKGKVLEAWATGTPVIGTPLAFEGMAHAPGFTNAAEFARCAAFLENADAWQNAANQTNVYLEAFSPAPLQKKLVQSLEQLSQANTPAAAPNTDWVSKILRHSSLNATKYFSRWIELKEQKNHTNH